MSDQSQKETFLQSGLSGRDHYLSVYRNSMDRQSEWLRRTAGQKVDAICHLLARNNVKPATILEVGCGTGAVIGELQRRSIATSYFGVDYSEEAIQYLKATLPGIHCAVGDVMDSSALFTEQAFDVIICSHVIEHLEQPEGFLQSVLQLNCDVFVMEVPLENLLFGKIKGLIKDRKQNPAGHVQFFDTASFLALLTDAGFNVADIYRYAPYFDKETIEFAYADAEGPRWKYIQKMVTEHYCPKYFSGVWKRMYHAHIAVLCQ